MIKKRNKKHYLQLIQFQGRNQLSTAKGGVHPGQLFAVIGQLYFLCLEMYSNKYTVLVSNIRFGTNNIMLL